MEYRFSHFILSGLLFFLMLNAQATCQLSDDKHQYFNFTKPAQRIISLAPDLTEIVFALNLGSRLVGVLQGSDYPQAAKKITLIGSYSGIDIEKILLLQPDLIVTWGGMFSRQLAILKKWGIPVYVSEPQNLDDIAKTLKNLACLSGKQDLGNTLAKNYLQQLSVLKKRYQHKTPLKVFYQIGQYSLITINKHSWINQAITLCGGKNVFANASFASPEVSWEAVIHANPQAIINDSVSKNWEKPWLQWTMLAAVKHSCLFSLDPSLMERASPRLINGVAAMCSFLDQCRQSHHS